MAKVDNFSGICMMVVHAISLSFYYVIIEILNNTIHPFQIASLYTFAILVFVSLSCLKRGFKVHLKTRYLKYHVIRGFLSSFATLFLFFSIQVIGISDAAAFSKLEHCFMVIIGIFLFNEKLNLHKVILLFGSLFGVIFLIDFRKLTGSFNRGYIYMLIALSFWVLNNIYIKKLTQTEESRSQLFYSSLFAVIVNICIMCIVNFLPYSIQIEIGFKWHKINVEILMFICVLSFTKFLHKLMFFNSYKVSDISIVSPFDYSRLMFTSFLAFLFFNKLPNFNEIVGYSIIMLAGGCFIVFQSKK